jgi:hypothetical protein
MTPTQPPGWYLLNPEDRQAQYWNGQSFTGDMSPRFNHDFPVFDAGLGNNGRSGRRRTSNRRRVDSGASRAGNRTHKVMSGIVGGGFALFMLASCVAIVSNGASNDGSATADSSSISEAVVEQPVEAPPVEVAPVEPEPVVEPVAPPVVAPPVAPIPVVPNYQNCSEVEDAGAAPIRQGDPGWKPKFDGDGDGIGCDQPPY